ncbi:VOC family protein [Nonomuraea ceibae]|uniref:VOC family protein n=1 Tax=Nonomuraea ceibae TaxID=1935170 RepID=UPI001C5F007C|nr:VOC family protein [Nonomuraea ceibae]
MSLVVSVDWHDDRTSCPSPLTPPTRTRSPALGRWRRAGPQRGHASDQTGPFRLFIRVPEGKSVKMRVRLDIKGVQGRTRDQKVELLIELGATLFDDLRNPDSTGWVTMLDPEEQRDLRGQACR